MKLRRWFRQDANGKTSPKRWLEEAANGNLRLENASTWLDMARQVYPYIAEQVMAGDVVEARYMMNLVCLYLLKYRHAHGNYPSPWFSVLVKQKTDKLEVLASVMHTLEVVVAGRYPKHVSSLFWHNYPGLVREFQRVASKDVTYPSFLILRQPNFNPSTQQ